MEGAKEEQPGWHLHIFYGGDRFKPRSHWVGRKRREQMVLPSLVVVSVMGRTVDGGELGDGDLGSRERVGGFQPLNPDVRRHTPVDMEVSAVAWRILVCNSLPNKHRLLLLHF